MNEKNITPELSPDERVRVEAFGFDMPIALDELADRVAVRAADVAVSASGLLAEVTAGLASSSKRFVVLTPSRRVVISALSRSDAEAQFMERFGYAPGEQMEEVATND